MKHLFYYTTRQSPRNQLALLARFSVIFYANFSLDKRIAMRVF